MHVITHGFHVQDISDESACDLPGIGCATSASCSCSGLHADQNSNTVVPTYHESIPGSGLADLRHSSETSALLVSLRSDSAGCGACGQFPRVWSLFQMP